MSCPYGRPKEGDVPPGGTARSARSAPKVERGQGRAYDNGVAVALVEGSMSWARACPRLMGTGSSSAVERGQGRAYDNGVAVVEGSMSWARACPRLMGTGSSPAVEHGQGRAYGNGVAVVGRTARSAKGAH